MLQVVQRAASHTKNPTHGMGSGEKVDEFSDGEGDGHGNGGRDEEETYGKKEGLFLWFSECNDFAEGRARGGGRSETREKGGSGRWKRSETACKNVSGYKREVDGAG